MLTKRHSEKEGWSPALPPEQSSSPCIAQPTGLDVDRNLAKGIYFLSILFRWAYIALISATSFPEKSHSLLTNKRDAPSLALRCGQSLLTPLFAEVAASQDNRLGSGVLPSS